LLNLVIKEQFSGVSTDDAASHLNNFVELCEMQKYKDIDGAIIKFKLFCFSLRCIAGNRPTRQQGQTIDVVSKYIPNLTMQMCNFLVHRGTSII
jgi:hypothetical protein